MPYQFSTNMLTLHASCLADSRGQEEVFARSVGYWSGASRRRTSPVQSPPTYRRSESLHDPELFHSRFKRRGLDIELLCRAVGAANTPVASLKRPNDVGTFGFVKGAVGWFNDLRLKRFMTQLDLQYWTVRQNHRALDHVTKFTDIAGQG